MSRLTPMLARPPPDWYALYSGLERKARLIRPARPPLFDCSGAARAGVPAPALQAFAVMPREGLMVA